ncbi:MAG: MFS transporter [bacterium]|nr:MFS transporter [bacterium]
MSQQFKKDLQFYKFCMYGFLKNLRFFEPFLVLFFLEKGLTFLQIGTLYSIMQIAINILEIPTGVIADTLGRRRTMITSFVAYIVSFLVFNFSSGYSLFMVAMLFFSVGEAFRTGTHKAMIFEYLKIKGWKDQKVHYYGHTRSWSQMGSALSALIAAGIVFYTGSFQVIFLYSTIPYVMDLALMLTYPKALDGELKTFEKGKVKENLKRVVNDFIYSFKDPDMLRAIGNLSFYTGFYKAAKDYLQPILNTFALSLPVFVALEGKQRSSLVIGIVYFFLFIMNSFASRHSGKMVDKYKNLCKLLNITLLVGYAAGILSGVLILIGLPAVAILAYMGIYLLQNLRKPMGIANVSEIVRPDILATALSAESQISALSAAIIAPAIGFFADTFGIGVALIIVPAVLALPSPFYFVKNRCAPPGEAGSK